MLISLTQTVIDFLYLIADVFRYSYKISDITIKSFQRSFSILFESTRKFFTKRFVNDCHKNLY